MKPHIPMNQNHIFPQSSQSFRKIVIIISRLNPFDSDGRYPEDLLG
jgi:hypothetical protein